jgi:ubiquinone/menaquinone biosynthesis C-methylase UbiE/uncharacterized protein YbaR (Trm112 family)
MNGAESEDSTRWLELLCCPGCGADLEREGGTLLCTGCGHSFGFEAGIPRLFWPNEWSPGRQDVTDAVKAFYEETPFPNYDEFDSVSSLIRKARLGRFAKLLDDQVPPGARILECGCGTGQLGNFLSIANRSVFATDICVNSLELGQEFKEKNGLERVRFLQMNFFRPCFRPETFDLAIASGVLHHSSDPRLAFETIARLVRPGGFILVGLYHRYGRLITDLRRLVFRYTGDRFTGLDPNLRPGGMAAAKRRAWFMDQYKHPHESKHTLGEVMRWFEAADLDFVTSIPRSKPFQTIREGDRLFVREAAGNAFERLLVGLGMIFRGSREGGFFTAIGQKRA